MTDENTTTGSQSRRSRSKATPTGKIPQPSELDQRILRLLRDHRILTTEEICDLLTGDANTLYIQNRLTELFHEQWVRRPEPQATFRNIKRTSQQVYALGEKAARFLRIPVKTTNLNYRTLDHQHIITSFYRAILKAERASPDIRISRWDPFPKMPTLWIPYYGQELVQIPDGALTLERGGQAALFFLEAESGSHTGERTDVNQSSFAKKMRYFSTLFHNSRQHTSMPAQYQYAGFNTFRVLVALAENQQSHTRLLKTLAMKGKAEGIEKALFWFAPMDRIRETNPLTASIWESAMDSEPRAIA